MFSKAVVPLMEASPAGQQTHVEGMTIQCRWLFQFFLCIYSFLQFIQTFLSFFSERSGCSAEEPLDEVVRENYNFVRQSFNRSSRIYLFDILNS